MYLNCILIYYSVSRSQRGSICVSMYFNVFCHSCNGSVFCQHSGRNQLCVNVLYCGRRVR